MTTHRSWVWTSSREWRTANPSVGARVASPRWAWPVVPCPISHCAVGTGLWRQNGPSPSPLQRYPCVRRVVFLRTFLFWQFSVKLPSSLCIRINARREGPVFVGFFWCLIQTSSQLISCSFVFFSPWRVDIVFVPLIRYTLLCTSYSVICEIIHIHLKKFFKSSNLLRNTIFQVASLSVISKSNQYILLSRR